MKVYLIRHGQSEGNLYRRRSGWSSTPLSEEGRRQARETGKFLREIPFDRIYSSDLNRCRQTLQEALPGRAPILSEKLREIHVGSLTDMLADDCAAKYGEAYRQHMLERDFTPYGGETALQLRERVFDFIRSELEPIRDAERVAIFCHEGTIHAMLEYVLGTDVPLRSLRVANASVSVFSYAEGKWRLVQWNYTGGLAE